MIDQEHMIDDELEATIDDIGKLKDRSKHKDSDIHGLQDEADTLHGETDRLRDRSKFMESQDRELSVEIESRQDELDDIRKMKADVKRQLDSAMDELSAQRRQIENLESQIKRAQRSGSHIDRKNSKLDAEIEVIEAKIQDEERKDDAYKEDKKDLEEELRNINERIMKTKQESAQLKLRESHLRRVKEKPRHGGLKFGGMTESVHRDYFTREEQTELIRLGRDVLEAQDRHYREPVTSPELIATRNSIASLRLVIDQKMQERIRARELQQHIRSRQERVKAQKARQSAKEQLINDQLHSISSTLDAEIEEAEEAKRRINQERQHTQEALQTLVDEDPYVSDREALNTMLKVVPLARMRTTFRVRINPDHARRSGFSNPDDYLTFQLSIPRSVTEADLQPLDPEKIRKRQALLATAIDLGTTAPVRNYLSLAARRALEEDIETLPFVDVDPTFFEFDFSEAIPQLDGTSVINPEERNKFYDFYAAISKYIEKYGRSIGRAIDHSFILRPPSRRIYAPGMRIINDLMMNSRHHILISKKLAREYAKSVLQVQNSSRKVVYQPFLLDQYDKSLIVEMSSHYMPPEIIPPFERDLPMMRRGYETFISKIASMNPIHLASTHDRMFVQLAKTNPKYLVERLMNSFDHFKTIASDGRTNSMIITWPHTRGWQKKPIQITAPYPSPTQWKTVIDEGTRSYHLYYQNPNMTYDASGKHHSSAGILSYGSIHQEIYPVLSETELNRYLDELIMKSEGTTSDHLAQIGKEYARFIANEYPQIAQDNALSPTNKIEDYLIDIPPNVFKILDGVKELNLPTASRRILDAKATSLDKATALIVYLDIRSDQVNQPIARLVADLAVDIKHKKGQADDIMHRIINEINSTRRKPPTKVVRREPASPPPPAQPTQQQYRVSAYIHAPTETLRTMWNDLDRQINELQARRVFPVREIEVRNNTAQLIDRIEYLQATRGNPNEIQSLQDTVLQSFQNLRRGG